MKNKHGLSRAIPSDVKKQVRRQCGFGCVICGSNIFTYEHIIPEFKDAYQHDPKHIALLCHQCHGKVTRKRLSKLTVLKALKNPIARQRGFASEWFDFDSNQPTIEFGGSVIYNCPVPVIFRGVDILKISRPVEENSPILLSGIFYGKQGDVSLRIVDNEYFVRSDTCDMQVIGEKLTVYDEGEIILELISHPPNRIIISKLTMYIDGHLLNCTDDTIVVSRPNGAIQTYIGLCTHDNGRAGFSF